MFTGEGARISSWQQESNYWFCRKCWKPLLCCRWDCWSVPWLKPKSKMPVRILPFLGPPKWTQVLLGSIRENGNPRICGDHLGTWPISQDFKVFVTVLLWAIQEDSAQFYGLGMHRKLEQLLKVELWPRDSYVDSLSSDFSFSPRIHSSGGLSLWRHPACLPCHASVHSFPWEPFIAI